MKIICCLFYRFIVFVDNILSTLEKYSINKLPSDFNKLTALNVAELRKEIDLTQKELVEKSGYLMEAKIGLKDLQKYRLISP